MALPARVDQPSKEAIGRIAENQPGLLNLLVAYFVFEWKAVRIGNPPNGHDQLGKACEIPDYIAMWSDDFEGIDGVNEAVHHLLQAPKHRNMDQPGLVSKFLQTCAYGD